jgi:hypothetical protein
MTDIVAKVGFDVALINHFLGTVTAVTWNGATVCNTVPCHAGLNPVIK